MKKHQGNLQVEQAINRVCKLVISATGQYFVTPNQATISNVIRLDLSGWIFISHHHVDNARRNFSINNLFGLTNGCDGDTHQRGCRWGELVGVE